MYCCSLSHHASVSHNAESTPAGLVPHRCASCTTAVSEKYVPGGNEHPEQSNARIVAEYDNHGVNIGKPSVKGNSLGARSSGANSCHNSSVPVVSPRSKHNLTSRRSAGGTSTWHTLRKHILTAMKVSHRLNCVSKDTVSGLSHVLLSSAQVSLHLEYHWPSSTKQTGVDQGEGDHNG